MISKNRLSSIAGRKNPTKGKPRKSKLTDIISSKTSDKNFAKNTSHILDERKKALNTLQSDIEVSSKVVRFKQVDDTNFVSIECPSCNGVFGLKANVIDSNQANVYYYCPYCGEDRGLE